jgi:hypothetical protein
MPGGAFVLRGTICRACSLSSRNGNNPPAHSRTRIGQPSTHGGLFWCKASPPDRSSAPCVAGPDGSAASLQAYVRVPGRLRFLAGAAGAHRITAGGFYWANPASVVAWLGEKRTNRNQVRLVGPHQFPRESYIPIARAEYRKGHSRRKTLDPARHQWNADGGTRSLIKNPAEAGLLKK